jgi:hypothetical protein
MGYDPFSDVKQFMSGGSVAAKFPKVGFVVEGTVLSFRVSQRTAMKSGEPLYWEGKQTVEESKLKFESSKSSPANQLLLEVQSEPTGVTWETNQYIEKKLPDDDGVRTMYIHGNFQKALGKALRDAGGADIEKGAYIKATRKESVKMGDFMGFTYDVEWTPAKSNAKAATDFVGDPDADGTDPFAE